MRGKALTLDEKIDRVHTLYSLIFDNIPTGEALKKCGISYDVLKLWRNQHSEVHELLSQYEAEARSRNKKFPLAYSQEYKMALADDIKKYMREGHRYSAACLKACVCPTTFSRWLRPNAELCIHFYGVDPYAETRINYDEKDMRKAGSGKDWKWAVDQMMAGYMVRRMGQQLRRYTLEGETFIEYRRNLLTFKYDIKDYADISPYDQKAKDWTLAL